LQVVFLVEGSDLDSLSSAYAYTILNKDAYIYLPYSYNKSFQLALSIFKNKLKVVDKVPYNLEKAVFVDTSSLRKIKQTLKKANLNFEDIKIEIFDHHPVRNKKLKEYKNITFHFFKYGACTTHFVFEIEKKGIKLTKDDATLISLGIYEDTGSFRYTGTKTEDIKALMFLSKYSLNFDLINEILTKRFDEKTLQILENLIENLHILYIDNYKIGISSLTIDEYIPDVSSYFNQIDEFSKLDAVFAVLSSKNKVFVIGRSKTDSIDVGYILSKLGGGGHKRAGSANIKDISKKEVVELLHYIIDTYLKADFKIKDIMHKKFCVINKNTKIEALKEINTPVCIVVDEKENFYGIVFEKNIKYALKHNLTQIYIKDLSITDIFTLNEEQPVVEAEKQIFKLSQEIFPVLKGKKPVGIVSKLDILKALHSSQFETEKEVFISRHRLIPKKYKFKHRLEGYFSPFILNLLKEIGSLAKKLGMRAYIVGGIVRDIILGRKNLDIDIIVEGDAINLAKQFAKEKGYSFHKFEEFLTANVKVSDSLKIDFATARKETYEYPGAYPKVEKATLREDLFRRDFTINTLAVDITHGSFGTLLDYFNGYKDIKDGVIRILHQLSFIEDPIRILRAVRFAGRFSFKIGKTTEKLLKVAVDQNLLEASPKGRINLELNLSLNEEKVIEILSLMDKYKILESLLPEVNYSEGKKLFLEKTKDSIFLYEELFNKKVEKPPVYLTALLFDNPLAKEYLKMYHFENVIKTLEIFNKIKNKIKPDLKKSQIYKLIKNLPDEVKVLILSYTEEPISKKIVDTLKAIERKKQIISGKDLIDMGLKPSKEFANIIETVFENYLDGKIKTKKQIKRFVNENFSS